LRWLYGKALGMELPPVPRIALRMHADALPGQRAVAPTELALGPIRAQGEADAIIAVANALNNRSGPTTYLIAVKYVEASRAMPEGEPTCNCCSAVAVDNPFSLGSGECRPCDPPLGTD